MTHPKTFAPATIILILLLSVAGAIIGLQLLVTLGVTPNTSLVGALVAIILARIPFKLFERYRSVHVQNLAQSAISAATFGAANSLLLPIGVPYVLGRNDLIIPMFVGVACAMLLDAFMLYRMFGTRIFPAEGSWPPGIAAGEAIRAGDEGGRKAAVLGLGIGAGVVGNWLGVPMSAFGIAFIGNAAALTMFGLGLLVRGYSKTLFSGPMFQTLFPDGDVGKALLPHGFMIGAGLMALIQVGIVILRRGPDTAVAATAGRTLSAGFAGYVLIAAFIALLGGLFAELSQGMLLAFILYAAFAAFVHELIVGLAAMHSGWFPAFAVALITLMIGILLGFPIPALGLLVGFSAATGPAFADMGYDLKAGFLLRGNGADPVFEADGRWQQLLAAMTAFVVAIIVVALSWRGYFAQDLVPPVDRVYGATIKAGMTGPAAQNMFLWAVPGALLQLLGGQKRQLGILFATGLLIVFPMAGWAVLAGIVARMIWERVGGTASQTTMQVFGGGVIAGDALFSFFSSVGKNLARK
jgi:uncharacterized oligopeptide transporter (OPT) family protein